MKSKSQIKRMGVQQGLSLDEIIKMKLYKYVIGDIVTWGEYSFEEIIFIDITKEEIEKTYKTIDYYLIPIKNEVTKITISTIKPEKKPVFKLYDIKDSTYFKFVVDEI